MTESNTSDLIEDIASTETEIEYAVKFGDGSTQVVDDWRDGAQLIRSTRNRPTHNQKLEPMEVVSCKKVTTRGMWKANKESERFIVRFDWNYPSVLVLVHVGEFGKEEIEAEFNLVSGEFSKILRPHDAWESTIHDVSATLLETLDKWPSVIEVIEATPSFRRSIFNLRNSLLSKFVSTRATAQLSLRTPGATPGMNPSMKLKNVTGRRLASKYHAAAITGDGLDEAYEANSFQAIHDLDVHYLHELAGLRNSSSVKELDSTVSHVVVTSRAVFLVASISANNAAMDSVGEARQNAILKGLQSIALGIEGRLKIETSQQIPVFSCISIWGVKEFTPVSEKVVDHSNLIEVIHSMGEAVATDDLDVPNVVRLLNRTYGSWPKAE